MKKYMFVVLLLLTNRMTAQLSFGFTYTYALEGVEVEVVFKNSPAEKAGIKEGDLILLVNDTAMRMVPKERLANVFATAPVTSKFLLGYYGEDYEVYRGKTVTIIKEERSNFLNKCLEGNCINGTGKHIDMEGTVYEGSFKNSKRNGKGKSIAANNVLYDGEWKDNKRDGIGKAAYKVKGYDYSNKSWSYEGAWKNDMMEGTGKYVFGDGSYYTGQVKENKFEGKGLMYLKDSTLYEGEWKNSELNGSGIMIKKNGDTYTGTFVNNKLEGTVIVFTKATNTAIAREYKNGKPL
jgi:hypothetical protein